MKLTDKILPFTPSQSPHSVRHTSSVKDTYATEELNDAWRMTHVCHMSCAMEGAQLRMMYGACMSYVMRQWCIHHGGCSMTYDVWHMYVIHHAPMVHTVRRELNDIWRIAHVCHMSCANGAYAMEGAQWHMTYGTCMSYIMCNGAYAMEGAQWCMMYGAYTTEGAQWHMTYGACTSYVMHQWHIHHRGSSMMYDVWQMYVIHHVPMAHTPQRELNDIWHMVHVCHVCHTSCANGTYTTEGAQWHMMYGTCISYVMCQWQLCHGESSFRCAFDTCINHVAKAWLCWVELAPWCVHHTSCTPGAYAMERARVWRKHANNNQC